MVGTARVGKPYLEVTCTFRETVKCFISSPVFLRQSKKILTIGNNVLFRKLRATLVKSHE